MSGYTAYVNGSKLTGTALSTASTATAAQILSGYKAYNSSGTLMTGTASSGPTTMTTGELFLRSMIGKRVDIYNPAQSSSNVTVPATRNIGLDISNIKSISYSVPYLDGYNTGVKIFGINLGTVASSFTPNDGMFLSYTGGYSAFYIAYQFNSFVRKSDNKTINSSNCTDLTA